MSLIEHPYAYAGASTLDEGDARSCLTLVSETREDRQSQEYLKALARQPDITAKALRAVSEIVGSRFYVPPSMLARILREADPVATVSPGAVRFEGFSACCSAYIRLDIDDEALDVAHRSNGTTNVDFGPELRAALAQVRRDTKLEISIGADAVGISHDRATVSERKGPLPVRWVKGFGDVQLAMAGMQPAFTIPRVAAQRFLRSVPHSKSDHLQWISAAGSQVRSTSRETDGAVPLRGAHRLRILGTLAPQATQMQVYVNPTMGSSAWVLDLGAQRLGLILNAEPWRGFSGDGGLLSNLASPGEDGTSHLRAQLNWQDRLEPGRLADATGLSPERVEAGLARLAALGLLGFDLAQMAYFHRALPFDLEKLEALNPRLKAALKLVGDGAVTLNRAEGLARVRSKDVIHDIHLLDDGSMSCTCPWYAKHKTTRGPCRHALAVEIAMEDGK